MNRRKFIGSSILAGLGLLIPLFKAKGGSLKVATYLGSSATVGGLQREYPSNGHGTLG